MDSIILAYCQNHKTEIQGSSNRAELASSGRTEPVASRHGSAMQNGSCLLKIYKKKLYRPEPVLNRAK